MTPPPATRRIETWIFDLDNTLYAPEARLFDQIDRRMTGFIMEALAIDRTEADRLRRLYWEQHGATVEGLRRHHGIDPVAFLDAVHDIDLTGLTTDPVLAGQLSRLSGRRIVHTNGARVHAARVLAARGLAGVFEAVYAIEDKGFVPKPHPPAYAAVIAAARFAPGTAAMVEDDPRNLVEPRRLGMTTVWLRHDGGDGPVPDHVDHAITDLGAFLDRWQG